MTISDAFGSYATNGSKFLGTALMTFSLIGIEAILDSSFQCPSSQYSVVLAALYSISFFLGPAIVLIYLGLYYFPGFNKKKQWGPCWSGSWACVYVVLQIGKPAMIWLLIAMTDGQYLACFVVVVSHHQLDHDLYLFIFQTSGMLAITVVVILRYYISKCTCPCMDESQRTYRMLADVEGILIDDTREKEHNEEKERFLYALEHDREYRDRRLPNYMREKENLISAKLNKETTTNNENPNEDY